MKKHTLFLLTLAASVVILFQSFLYFRAGASSNNLPGPPSETLSRLSEEVSVRAAGRGNPWINFRDGRELLSEQAGIEALQSAAGQDQPAPLALVSADFDEDGIPDLVTAHRAAQGGLLLFYRGNPDAIYPNSAESKERRAAGRFTDAPFLSPELVPGVEITPDFIVSGDFDADGHKDIVAAAREGDSLHLLAGNGRGSFSLSKRIELPGRVTAIIAGEINRADGLADIAVGVARPTGARALIFQDARGALKAEPDSFALPYEAADFALGNFAGDYTLDLAVAAGSELIVIQGRDRDAFASQKKARSQILRRRLSSPLKSVATGNFTGDYRFELGLLTGEGEVIVLTPKKGKAKAGAKLSRSLDRWRIEKPSKERWPLASRVVCARVSSIPVDNLLVIDTAQRQLHIVTGGAKARSVKLDSVSMDVEGEPIAALGMRLNSDALTDLVVLRKGQTSPTVLTTAPMSIFAVVDAGDSGPGTLRQAINDANNSSGSDEIIFMVGSGPQTITLSSSLAILQETITIDATTQPGFSNSPIITLDGGGLSIDGLVLTGGSSVVRGLAIHNLGGNGILLGPIPSRGEGAAAPAGGNSFVEGNYIGLDSSGTGVSGVGGVGVLSTSIGNTIGGGSPSSGNVIALTGGDGVDAFFGDVVQSNLIGTDATGVTGLGGSGNGVIVSGSGAFIGGVKGSGNVIASQSLNGIEIRPDLNGVIIQGNSIGTDDTGSVALGNLNNGINLVDANGCMIGSSFGGGNLISGNGNNGIVISGASAVSNSALNNLIGVQGDGTSPLGNGGHGILIDNDASSNTIGGLGFIEGNVIAFNGGDGISVDTGTGNALRGNSIFSNTGLGIDLSPDGVTPNDLMDGDTGPNNLQNFPVLTSATLGNGIVTIQGTFNSTVDSSFVIDFYVSPTCDQSGNGEGQMWLGSANVITDASGNATINELLMASVTSGDVITATATSSGGSTSEFSACVTAGAGGCVTFDNDGGDGLWQNQLNWSGDQLPGAGDNACIPSAFTVTLSSGAQSIAGLMNDGTLIISGGDLLISAASTSNNLTINSGSMLSIGDTFAVSGNMTIAGGNVTGGGTLAINSGAVLNITSGASFIGVTVNNSGTTNWTNPGSIFMDSGAVFNNLPGGLFHAQNEGVDVFSMGGGAFNNSGEFRKSTSTGSVSFAGGVPFNNSGTVDVQLGTLSFGSGYTQTAGNLLLNGGDLSIDGTILIQGGALSGSGTINGSVSNGGQVNPGGSPGIINIAGDYTQTSTGVLNIEIGGLTAGTQYDRLIVGGIAMLDGTLNLMLINSFSPNVGDTFQVLNYMSLTGSFATINGLNIGGGRSFQPSFNATDLTFAVVGGASSDLSVTKTGSPDPVAAGGNITYTIQVSNSGPDAASTVQLDEAVPANTTFQSITAPPGWSCSTPAVGGTGAITCTTNLLPVLSTANFTLVVRVDPGTADNTIITNTATVTSSITDPAPTNNTAGATTTVMTPPCTNICPADMSVNADPAQCGAVVSYTVPPGSGNCGTITCSPAPGSFFPVGVTVVTCMATVGTSCSFNVTVIDNQRPRVTCPGNITTSTTTGSTTVDYVLASATDNCSGATVICVPPSGTVFPLGVNTVNCSATDSAGNTSTCAFTITVNDGRSPTINCPPNVIIEATAGQCAATVTYPDPVVTDPASTSVVIACVPPSGSTFPLGATTVICSATNQAGNRVSCSFTVLVNAPPQIRVTLEGGGTSLQPGPVDPPLRQRDNPPASCDCDSTFTIENTGCSPFTLTLSEIARTGADVDSGRITNTDDGSFFSVRLVAADQSETRLSTGSQVSFDAGQRRTFRLVFNPVIPAFTGRTTNLSASNALPNPVTSRIVFNQGGASPLSVVIPISGRVSTGVRLLNPDNSRDTKRVIFTRSGNEFTVSLAVFDSNQDVNLIRYEFLDGQGRTVDQAFDIDMTDAIRQSNIIRGQSFKVIQRFTGANSRLQITSVRVTVFDAGSNDTFTAQLQGGTTSSAAIRSVFGQGTLVLPDLLLGGGARKF